MRIIVSNSPLDASTLVTNRIMEALAQKPDLVLGLATGSTPINIYHNLVKACREGRADFSRVTTFNLDEYLDLPADHPQGYRYFMDKHFFSGVNLKPENIHFPPISGPSLDDRCLAFEEKITAVGGIDIQLLGIGSNGHIGFNEPTSSLGSRTRIKTLTEKTLRDNSRFYGPGEVQPTMAATMGIATILDCKQIFMQAFGVRKAEAIQACIEGPVSAFWPGSALQFHAHTTFFLDNDSSALLRMRDYYALTRENQERLEKEGLL